MPIFMRQDGAPTYVEGDREAQIWSDLLTLLKGIDARATRNLAIYALRSQGWPLGAIAETFGLHKGHVLRIVRRTALALASLNLPPKTIP